MHDDLTLRRRLRARPAHVLLLGWLAAASLAACSTLGTEAPPRAAAALAGLWQLDAASSDDFDAKLKPLLENQRRRMTPRHGAGGGRGRGGDGEGADAGSTRGEPDALTMPPEEPEKVRTRLADALRPPASLRIAVDGDTIDITPDAEPTRRFQPDQEVSRIDASGAASLASGWEQGAFVVRARYVNKSTRSWRYEPDPASGELRVSFEANDVEFGKFALQTRYRRAP